MVDLIFSSERNIFKIISRNWDGPYTRTQHKWSDLNLADRCPCRVVETLALRTVFLTFLCNIPTEESWWVYLFRLFLMGTLGHFDDVAVCSQVEKASWGKVRVCFSCLFGFTWLRQNTTPLFQLASKMFVFNQCIWKFSIVKDVKQ